MIACGKNGGINRDFLLHKILKPDFISLASLFYGCIIVDLVFAKHYT